METPLSPLRRWLVVAACFAVGAAIALFAVDRLGAFRPPEPGIETYRTRALAAMASGAFDEPPNENVREITDAALRRWPGATGIVSVRQSAAKDLVDRAGALRDSDRDKVGFITYALAKLIAGKMKDAAPAVLALALLFAIKFAVAG